ncbi:MAG: hypothetical protein JWN48_440 [Myxococcaceae bacterium]|nr:hypothetical protein [Myxococcaceae bacterium]
MADAAGVTASARSEASSVGKREVHKGIEWFVDSPDAALKLAEQTGRLVLVDLWAPWCHTCLSMREYVLTAENLSDVRERLVFLALNTELPENASWLQRWAVSTWPTLYLVDSAGNVQGRWVGAASPAQLSRFVRESLHAADATLEGSLAKDDPLALLIVGDRESAEGDLAAASQHYREALRHAAPDWPRRPETWVALAGALRKLGERKACVQLGLEVLGSKAKQLGASASATDFVYHVLDCGSGLDARDRSKQPLARAAATKLRALCERGSDALTPDDRGDACGLLAEERKREGDNKGSKRAAEQRLSILERAAAGVPDAVALTYDWARAESLLQLGRGTEALSLLEAREKALPDDYSPPYYLARVDLALGRCREGLAAVQRAIALAYGPRHAGMLTLKTDLLLACGEKDEARRTLQTQLSAYRSLPQGQRQPARESAVEQRLREL